MQYITSALGLLSRLSLFVVFTPILAVWFFVWMVIATAFAWFAWLIVIIKEFDGLHRSPDAQPANPKSEP